MKPVKLAGRRDDRGLHSAVYSHRRREVVCALTTHVTDPSTKRQVEVRHSVIAFTLDKLFDAIGLSAAQQSVLEQLASQEPEDEEPVNFILHDSETIH